MISHDAALKWAERLIQIKSIFTENNLPITDDVALKVLSLLEWREIINDEAFERMVQFAIHIFLLNTWEVQPKTEDKINEGIDHLTLDDIFSGFRWISKTLKDIASVTTLWELRNYISQKWGIKGLLEIRGLWYTRLCDIYIYLRKLSNPPKDIIEKIEEYYKSKIHTQPSKYFFIRLQNEWISPLNSNS